MHRGFASSWPAVSGNILSPKNSYRSHFFSNLLCYKAMATLPFKAGCCAERSVRVFKVPGLKIHTKGVNLNLHSDFSLLHLVTDIFLKIPGPNFLFP